MLFALWLTLSAGAAAYAEPGRAEALIRTRHLEAELALAQKPALYAVVDLERREVQLKARGVVFRAWPVLSHRLWGGGLPTLALALEDKDALFAPQRPEVALPAPGGDAAPAPKAEALEVADMPSRYTLLFPGGVAVVVAPRPEGLAAGLRAFADALVRLAAVPLRTLWSRATGEAFAVLELALDEAEARALYWALTPGMPTLFWFPQAPTPAD